MRAIAPSGTRKTSLIFAVEERPGSLARCLGILAERNVNGDKLESKPFLGHGTERMFYIDFDGDVTDANVADALAELKTTCPKLIVLGSYDAHVGAPIGANERAPKAAVNGSRDARPAEPIALGAETPFPRVSRVSRPESSALQIGGVRIADGEFVIVAGPCSVESREQILETAEAVRARGAMMLRGGAFKPRTSPYAFQGLGWEGVDLLAEAGRAIGTADRERSDDDRSSRAHGRTASTCCRSARATCKTSTCSKRSAGRDDRCCSSAVSRRRSTSCWPPRNTFWPKGTRT